MTNDQVFWYIFASCGASVVCFLVGATWGYMASERKHKADGKEIFELGRAAGELEAAIRLKRGEGKPEAVKPEPQRSGKGDQRASGPSRYSVLADKHDGRTA